MKVSRVGSRRCARRHGGPVDQGACHAPRPRWDDDLRAGRARIGKHRPGFRSGRNVVRGWLLRRGDDVIDPVFETTRLPTDQLGGGGVIGTVVEGQHLELLLGHRRPQRAWHRL